MEGYGERCFICFTDITLIETSKDKECLPNSGGMNGDLHVIFLLRNILEIPGDSFHQFLGEWGRPSEWRMPLCGDCSNTVENVRWAYQEVLEATGNFRTVKNEIIETIKRSTESEVEAVRVAVDVKPFGGNSSPTDKLAIISRAFVSTHNYGTFNNPFVEGDRRAMKAFMDAQVEEEPPIIKTIPAEKDMEPSELEDDSGPVSRHDNNFDGHSEEDKEIPTTPKKGKRSKVKSRREDSSYIDGEVEETFLDAQFEEEPLIVKAAPVEGDMVQFETEDESNFGSVSNLDDNNEDHVEDNKELPTTPKKKKRSKVQKRREATLTPKNNRNGYNPFVEEDREAREAFIDPQFEEEPLIRKVVPAESDMEVEVEALPREDESMSGQVSEHDNDGHSEGDKEAPTAPKKRKRSKQMSRKEAIATKNDPKAVHAFVKITSSGRIHCRCGTDYGKFCHFVRHIRETTINVGAFHECTICKEGNTSKIRRFKRNEDLTRHIREDHEDKKRACHLCGKRFFGSNLPRHIREIHERKHNK